MQTCTAFRVRRLVDSAFSDTESVGGWESTVVPGAAVIFLRRLPGSGGFSRILCPLSRAGSIAIGGSSFSFEVRDGRMAYFSNLEAIVCHDAGDHPARLLRTTKFAESRMRRVELEAAFGVSRSTVKHVVNRLRSQGEAGFLRAESGTRAQRAGCCDGLGGGSVSCIGAGRLGAAVSTIRHNGRAGVVGSEAVPARPGASVGPLLVLSGFPSALRAPGKPESARRRSNRATQSRCQGTERGPGLCSLPETGHPVVWIHPGIRGVGLHA